MTMQVLFVKVCYIVINVIFKLSCIIVSVEHANCTNGEVRLVGGNGPHEGRVEVCVNEVWGTVCSNGWNTGDSNVVCRQIGYMPLGLL